MNIFCFIFGHKWDYKNAKTSCKNTTFTSGIVGKRNSSSIKTKLVCKRCGETTEVKNSLHKIHTPSRNKFKTKGIVHSKNVNY